MNQGLIYKWFPQDNSPVIDYTGTTVGFNLQYSPNDDGTFVSKGVADPTIPPAANSLFFPANLVKVALSPSTFKTIWGGYSQKIQKAVANQLDAVMVPGYQQTTAIAPSGRARARTVSNGPLLIDYWISYFVPTPQTIPLSWLPGAVTVDVSGTFKGGSLSGSFQIAVDVELLFIIYLQWPTATVTATANLFNVNIRPTGDTALFWGAIEAYYNTEVVGSTRPTLDDVIAGYEDSIEYTTLLPAPDMSSLAAAFGSLGSAAIPLGLLQCLPVADQNAASPLTFNLIHPVDPPPAAYNLGTMASPIWPILGGPTLATSQTQVTPASQVGVTGSQFPPSNVVGIGWGDTCSGKVINSVVTGWGPDGQPLTAVELPRPAHGPQYTIPAQAGQAYQLQVSDQDGLTTTQPSNPPVEVQGADPLDLVLAYESSAPPQQPLPGKPPPPPSPPHPAKTKVGTASAGADGTFSVTANIPADAVPCSATLYAQSLGMAIASTQLSIVASIERALNIIDPTTGAIQAPAVNPGFAVCVRGEGFVPKNTVVALYIDNTSGLHVAAAFVGNDTTFKCSFIWPQNLPTGPHSLLAVNVGRAKKTIEATLTVTQEATVQ